jgi:hypothetical protein
MRVKTLRRLRFWSRLAIASTGVIFIGMEYLYPWTVKAVYATEYKRLVVECDQAMHDEVSLRQVDESDPQSRLMRDSADAGLLICHDYDKLRKTLLISGVTEHQLSLLGLEALEQERIPVTRMVAPHRMPRF